MHVTLKEGVRESVLARESDKSGTLSTTLRYPQSKEEVHKKMKIKLDRYIYV